MRLLITGGAGFFASNLAKLAVANEVEVSHPEPVNLAFGTNTTLTELVETIGHVTGRATQMEHLDERPGDVKNSQADNTVLRSLFPEVQPVPLEQGIAETAAWFETSR